VVNAITAQATTKTREELETVYWPFLHELLSHLHQLNIPFSENTDLKRLSRTIIKPLIESVEGPPISSPPTPPQDWTKRSRGCGCQGICALLDQFLQDPHMKSQYFQALTDMQLHLRKQVVGCSDICITWGLNGLLLTKIFPEWEKDISKCVEDDNSWRKPLLATANKIGNSVFGPFLEEFLGEQIFELWIQFREKASAPGPPIPTLPPGSTSCLPEPHSLPSTSALNASQSLAAGFSSGNRNLPSSISSNSKKRNLPWQSNAVAPTKKRGNNRRWMGIHLADRGRLRKAT